MKSYTLYIRNNFYRTGAADKYLNIIEWCNGKNLSKLNENLVDQVNSSGYA